jgi:uncharacterized repeat protein (TIGR03847 family)
VIYEFSEPERFIVGTVGVPGEREFFLQIRDSQILRTFKCEKEQIIALIDRLQEMLREIKKRDSLVIPVGAPDDNPLEAPIDSEFSIGSMSLRWDGGRLSFEATPIERELESDAGEQPQEILRVWLTPEMVAEFVRRGERVVSAGRAPCIFCGGPVNLDGHLCPRANGYRR